MHNNNRRQSGFSLIELLISMTLSLVLILGVSSVFSSLKGTAKDSIQLENTQEVLRFANFVFRRAIHRADSVEADTYTSSDGATSYSRLILRFDLANLDDSETYSGCTGGSYSSTFYETYRLNGNQLECVEYSDSTLAESAKSFTAIGTNIDALIFSKSNDLLTVSVTAEDEKNSVAMLFAQRQTILSL